MRPHPIAEEREHPNEPLCRKEIRPVLTYHVAVLYETDQRHRMHVNVFDFSKLLAQSTERYLEFVRVPGFSVGIYVLDGGAMDHQKPHSEDEVYYVASGRAKMMINSHGDSSSFDVCAGTIIFVPARVHHSFYDIAERLALLVFFSPAEGSAIRAALK